MMLLQHGDERTHTPKTKSVFLHVLATFFFSVFFVNAALAAPDTNIYGNRVLSGTDPIYLIDPNDGSLTQVASSLFPSAALARSPVNGLLYYTQYNVTDSQVATWNPDTGIHTVIGNLGGGVGALARLAFRNNNVLYGIDNSCNMYTINTATGVATSVGLVTSVECDSGDLAFGANDVMYVVAGGADDTFIWTINLGTLVGTLVHDVQTEQSISGIVFAFAGAPYTVRELLLHYSPTWTETTIGAFGGPRLADAASSPIFADLSLAKIVDDATPDVGTNVVFTLTVTNAGPANATGVVVTDLLPSGYTYVSDDGGGDYDDATGIWTVGAVATGVPEVLNITATVLASGTYDNGAEITAAGQFDSDSTPDNDILAEDDQVLTTVTPNLPLVAPTMSKAFAPSPILSGATSTLTFTLSNPNASGLTGASFTDAYPAGMTNDSPLVTGGSCANVVTTAVAGGSSFDVTAGDIPASASCTITVDVTATAIGINTSGVLSTNEAPDSATGATDTLLVANGNGMYFWQNDSGTSVVGFMTDSTGCGNQANDVLLTTLMSAAGFNCTDFRHQGTVGVPQNLWLMIKDTVYAVATDVTGGDFFLDFLDDSSGGVTARYELGYAFGGVFTSFGFVDEGPHEPEALYVTDLSSISGTAPAGSHLALRIVDVAPSDGVMRMFMGSDDNSGILSVTETPAGPPSACPSGGNVTSTVDSTIGDTLRACIIWANGNPGVDTLTVSAGTYTLTIAGTGENAAATGDLDITESIIINGNAAGATIVDANSIDRVFDILGATLTATNLTIRNGATAGGDDGGGIAIDGTGTLALSNSTVSGNSSSDEGGGIDVNEGTLTLINVTISGNSAVDDGGGIRCTGTCTLTNVTVTDNSASSSGDGIREESTGTVTMLNTIVANNGGGGDNCSGTPSNFVSSGWNLSSDATCNFVSAGDQVNTDPLLGVLQDNGGPTFTHALSAGSLANDGGTDTGCPTTDQRGTGRPLGGSCDIGAFEAAAQAVCPGAIVTNTTDAPTGGSLRACIIWANGNAGADSISFNIVGAGPHTIRPTSGLPSIDDPVTIDGSTEPDFVTTPVIQIDGTFAGTGNTARGLRIIGGSDGSTIRALVINRFDNRGMHITSAGNTIVGNWIGLDIDGVTAAGNGAQGIFFNNAGDNATVGGTVDADRNVISGNSSQGIAVRGDNNVIIGNYIGTDSLGAVAGVGNGSHGIRIRNDGDGNTVGGTTAAHANVIADNSGDGIWHDSTGTANSFLRNSIYGNSELGIDLAPNNVTANDAFDPDPGPNNLLNFPVITAAVETVGTLNVDFDLDVIPAGNYHIEFFTNPSGADPSGNGEGEVYQDAVTIAHGGVGVESFSHSFAGSAGDIVTVTATLELGGPTYAATSEFGAAFTAVLGTGLEVVKRAFWLDGTPIPTGVDIPSGVQFRFMLYVSNPGALVADVSIQDALDPAFGYVGGSIMYDNSVVNCAADPCTALEEAAIFTAVDSGTVGTDPVNGDVVSYIGSTLDVGNEVQANLQLDILANRVWAVMFTVTIL